MPADRRSFLATAALALPAALHLGQQPLLAQNQNPQEPAAPASSPDPVSSPDQAELERRFTEKLSGCVFAGSYSVTAGADEKAAVMEKYTIAKVAKVKDEQWQFTAKWQIGKNEFPIVIPLTVKWAGDTPVITLDNLTIPGLGTFSSRVLIHGDWYAGTWLHGKVGGHLWGRVEKLAAD
ncbi:MAG: hypothetical protein EHM42_08345 [Planctomycetaceae bacterium]|nr:MAG: hypothetical protein EHM42_08345 [Planctomycetaceae bacterium]